MLLNQAGFSQIYSISSPLKWPVQVRGYLVYNDRLVFRCDRAGAAGTIRLAAVRCPAGLAFDIGRQTCDWKAKVDNCDRLSSNSTRFFSFLKIRWKCHLVTQNIAYSLLPNKSCQILHSKIGQDKKFYILSYVLCYKMIVVFFISFFALLAAYIVNFK